MGAKTQINVILKGKNADILIFFASKMHGTTYIPTEDEELPNGDFVSKFKVSMEEAGDIYIKIVGLMFVCYVCCYLRRLTMWW